MKVLVTGVSGQLGHDVVNELKKRNHKAIGVTSQTMDITNFSCVNQVIKNYQPDAVIHCAAWTAVDAAEDVENQDRVHQVNGVGTENIAKVCKELDIKMMYISTDYVFDGQGEQPWKPDSTDYQPLNIYGQTKLEGEQAVSSLLSNYFIVRIAWVFGINGNNFVKTMLKAGKNHDHLNVVNDQIGTPTYTYDLARLLVDMISSDKYGYYHATNEGGYISWYEFACEIFRQAHALGHNEYMKEHLAISPVTTEQYGISKARRPFNSRLDTSKLQKNGFTPLPSWKDALSRYLREIEF